MPTAERSLEAAQGAGFDVSFETDFALDGVDGFLPVTLDGIEAGFELFVEQTGDGELSARVLDASATATYARRSSRTPTCAASRRPSSRSPRSRI